VPAAAKRSKRPSPGTDNTAGTPAAPIARAGTEVDLASGAPQSPDPLLPHERDEKTGMTGGVQSPRLQQGARDLKRGLQDTSRAPEADQAYRKLKK
jgi:hypothetical protein